ncbi:hypothetical protein [Adhaeretor mobilis]|uniref:OstA-like protein n=1 Tax=Adhaeretor mobilis TaxID=1930276 RepID=A0A517N395_9BACT|nr:hypothetical protein [Adhaeretor mobilis]QDT01606.1 hypothetical protein HG15A2_49530 [Adhaeretor mobilis]
MLTRLTHAAIAFAITAVCYQVYALTVVPRVQPATVRRDVVNYDTPREPTHKYRELLAAYVPKGHWSLLRPPKTFQNGQTMIVADVKDMASENMGKSGNGGKSAGVKSNSGQIRVERCLLLAFPKGWQLGQDAPRNAVILEAPHGAVIQLDSGAKLGSAMLGKFQWGQLLGDITIRSDMNEPGPQDDLLITTRDLYINESGINTHEAVELRLASHYARGKGLNVAMLPPGDERRRGSKLGPFETLEITEGVAVDLAVDNVKWLKKSQTRAMPATGSLTLGDASGGPQLAAPRFDSASTSSKNSPQPPPPVRIRCQGAFTFDFLNYIASFRKDVQIRQVHPNGTLDQLLASEVNLYFTEGTKPVGSSEDQGLKSYRFGTLQPATVEAKGAPVKLDAPSQQATARCERLRLMLDQRTIVVDGGDEVTLTFRGSEIHAPMVQYQQPPEGSSHQLGNLLAAGGGWLKAVVDQRRPSESLDVSWKRSMEIVRRKGQPVLSLLGRPKLAMPGVGRLWAEDLKLYLRESTAKSPAGSSTLNLSDRVRPERMVATGHVDIHSPEITAEVNELSLTMRYEDSLDQAGQPTGRQTSSGQRSVLNRDGKQRGRSYGITGNKLQMQIAVRGKTPEVSRLSVDGNVLFQEYLAGGAPDRQTPLRIVAGNLEVENADTPDARIMIRGRKQSGGRTLPAEIEVRGTKIRAPLLTLNRGSSSAEINSPGEIEMLSDRDFNGQPLANPQSTTITWQQAMRLAGDRLSFRGDVRVRNASGWLQTKQLLARLTNPVSFDGAAADRKVELAQLECTDGVLAEFDDRDAAGLTSHQRVELQSLSVNQITGDISGEGPGRLESVHLNEGSNSLAQLSGGSKNQAASRNDSGQRLRYLRTDFTRGVQGNLHSKRVKLIGNVQTVYGPVDAWEQRLAVSGVDGPGPNTVWIKCDELEVAESPAGRLFAPPGGQRLPTKMGPLELTAQGRVVFEAQHPTKGFINARGNRSTYDQAKTLFVIEGSPVNIAHQAHVGAPFNESTASKLQYWANTGEMKGSGIEGSGLFMDFDKFNVGRESKNEAARR